MIGAKEKSLECQTLSKVVNNKQLHQNYFNVHDVWQNVLHRARQTRVGVHNITGTLNHSHGVADRVGLLLEVGGVPVPQLIPNPP